MTKKRHRARKARHRRVRSKISGTTQRPRLNVYRSLNNIYAQVIDDTVGHTLVAASTLDKEVVDSIDGLTKKEQAALVGKKIAERSLAAGVEVVVFDRGGYLYHGRVEALAKAAREGGLKF